MKIASLLVVAALAVTLYFFALILFTYWGGSNEESKSNIGVPLTDMKTVLPIFPKNMGKSYETDSLERDDITDMEEYAALIDKAYKCLDYESSGLKKTPECQAFFEHVIQIANTSEDKKMMLMAVSVVSTQISAWETTQLIEDYATRSDTATRRDVLDLQMSAFTSSASPELLGLFFENYWLVNIEDRSHISHQLFEVVGRALTDSELRPIVLPHAEKLLSERENGNLAINALHLFTMKSGLINNGSFESIVSQAAASKDAVLAANFVVDAIELGDPHLCREALNNAEIINLLTGAASSGEYSEEQHRQFQELLEYSRNQDWCDG